jgi:hypothetical protein
MSRGSECVFFLFCSFFHVQDAGGREVFLVRVCMKADSFVDWIFLNFKFLVGKFSVGASLICLIRSVLLLQLGVGFGVLEGNQD